MNRNLLLLVVLITFGFTSSCSKDDDVIETINETFIIGKWRLSSITENGANVSLNDCEKLKTLEFNTSFEVTIKTYDFNMMDDCEISSNNIYDYSISHNLITIESEGEAEVSTPRNETLILKFIEDSNVTIQTLSRE
nr:lipocalin family protein [uncultured Psychroserpens sp.]